jgi:hypothetical protein
VADHDPDESGAATVSRRAFLKGGAAATGALSASLLPAAAEAQLPDKARALESSDARLLGYSAAKAPFMTELLTLAHAQTP